MGSIIKCLIIQLSLLLKFFAVSLTPCLRDFLYSFLSTPLLFTILCLIDLIFFMAVSVNDTNSIEIIKKLFIHIILKFLWCLLFF